MNTFFVSLLKEHAVQMIKNAIINGSISGELIDAYTINTPQGLECIVLIFEKYYNRVSNRLTLTVVIDDFCEKTRVHYISGGGGEGFLFNFDWGASESFASVVPNTLSQYIIQ